MANEEVSGQPTDTVPPGLLSAGLVLGLLGDQLLWTPQQPAITGFAVWTGLLGLMLSWQQHRQGKDWKRVLPWTVLPFLLALLLVWRLNGFLVFGVILSLTLCCGFLILQAQEQRLRTAGLLDLARLQLYLVGQYFSGWFRILQTANFKSEASHPVLKARIRGALLAAPLVVVFALLFGAADNTFNQFLNSVFSNFSKNLVLHIWTALICSLFSLGLLHAQSQTSGFVLKGAHRANLLGEEELRIILGALCVLFIGFGVLQLSYLFGGRALIESTTGMTVANYARRGFFELLFAAALTLGVLLVLHTNTVSTTLSEKLFTWLGAVLLGCVAIMLISAVQRMLLYTAAFGLSLDRLVALAILGWLGVCLMLFAATLLRHQPEGFASGAAFALIAVVFVVGVVNPAALVVDVNVNRHIEARQPLDINYLISLGPDARRTLLTRLDELPAQAQCVVAFQIENYRTIPSEQPSLKSRVIAWQYSRASESRLLMQMAAQLADIRSRNENRLQELTADAAAQDLAFAPRSATGESLCQSTAR